MPKDLIRLANEGGLSWVPKDYYARLAKQVALEQGMRKEAAAKVVAAEAVAAPASAASGGAAGAADSSPPKDADGGAK